MLDRTRGLSAEEVKQELQIADRLAEMMATEGWKIYEKLIAHHLRVKENEATSVMQTMDDALARNAQNGAVMAFRLCRDLPASIIRAAEDLRSLKGSGNDDE